MFKLLYKPVAIVAGIVGGVLSGLIFKQVWKVAGRGSDPPAPLDSERGWGRSCSPQSCMARYTRWSRRLSTAAPPSGRARKPGSGLAARSSTPASHPTITKLKPPPAQPGDCGTGKSQLRRRPSVRHAGGRSRPPTRLPPDGDTPPVWALRARSDRGATSTGQRAWWTYRESALDPSPPAERAAAVSPMGEGRRTATQAPVSWGQARASGKTGAREQLGDDGRTRAPRCSPRAVDDTLARAFGTSLGAAGRP